ncbi:fungal-specific transcription factor domain-containing protein [Gongronella butleri]|nr:fungal-specific transcription factor domain-containing protein [Gongronella butleri]
MAAEKSSSPHKGQGRPAAASEKRNKSSQACDFCKKKKVKCDGGRPCRRCIERKLECAYTTKINTRVLPDRASHQSRLELIVKALATLDLSPPSDLDHDHEPFSLPTRPIALFDAHTHGQPYYVRDWTTRRDRLPATFDRMVALEPEPRKPEALGRSVTPIIDVLLRQYLQHVHHYFPLIHLPSFQVRLALHQDGLLLNAMYAVAQQWQHLVDTSLPRELHHPPGWAYYLQTLSFLEVYMDAPRLTTIQAILLLLRYQDLLQRTGYLWRSRSMMLMVVRMCHDLSLHRTLPPTCHPDPVITEQRNRIFWVAFIYDCTIDYPVAMSDEQDADHQQALLYFRWMTIQIKIQAQVLQCMRRKSGIPTELKEHHDQFGVSIRQPNQVLTSRFKFLFLLHHFNTILLYRALVAQAASPQLSSPSSTHSRSSMPMSSHEATLVDAAQTILTILSDLLLDPGVACLHYNFRGVQQVIHYVSAARTVFQQYQLAAQDHQAAILIAKLVPFSPMTELHAVPLPFDVSMDASSSPAMPAHQQPLQQQVSIRPPTAFPPPSTSTTTSTSTFSLSSSSSSSLDQLYAHQAPPVASSPVSSPSVATAAPPMPAQSSVSHQMPLYTWRTYPPAYPAHHLPPDASNLSQEARVVPPPAIATASSAPMAGDASLPSSPLHRMTLCEDPVPSTQPLPSSAPMAAPLIATLSANSVDDDQDIPSRHLVEQDPTFWHHDAFFDTNLPPG